MINFFLKIFYYIRKFQILKRVSNSFLRRTLFLIKKDKFSYNYKNCKFYLNIRDSIDREIFMNGYYEETQINILSKNIEKYSIDHFVDVGSNIGIYSILMANKFSNLVINSFEPHPDAYKRLNKNIEINNLKNKIYTHNLALSNKNGSSYLISKQRFNISQSGGAKISDIGKTKIKNKIGDDILKINNKSIAIKIDTEGHEFEVLQGIQKLLNNNKIFLQIEIFPENTQRVLSFLEKLNFKLLKKDQFTHQENIFDYFFEKSIY